MGQCDIIVFKLLTHSKVRNLPSRRREWESGNEGKDGRSKRKGKVEGKAKETAGQLCVIRRWGKTGELTLIRPSLPSNRLDGLMSR